MLNKVVNKIQESLYTFVPNKSFVQLLGISPEKVTFLKTFDSQFL